MSAVHAPPPPPQMGQPPHSGGAGAPPTGDSYFTETKKGEVNELRQLLRTFGVEKDPVRKREIIKKVIGYMTLGIDVSRLFSEMMLVIETRDLVIKKMAYLYMCNYATSHPELAQMCTNTLQKDCGNDDPMVRGLALRALCSLRLPQMVEYIAEPLRRSLTDPHAYVRKTGVMGVLKMYHLDVSAFEREGFVEKLYDMLRDTDASVVSNCILVLNEVMASGPDGGMAINRPIMLHLLNRIHEFPEFGISSVIDLVAKYRPYDDQEAYQVMNLLDPVLRTSNSGAVMSTIKAFLSMADRIVDGDPQTMREQVAQRVCAPMVTLVTGGIPELMHCLLHHIEALVLACPGVFDSEYRQFYARYNEPTYVQYLKVNILWKLANAHNGNDIIAELAHYANDSNVVLSRLAIRGMAGIGCRRKKNGTSGAFEENICLRLIEMLDLDVGHVPAEAAVALADLVRIHPELSAMVAPRLPRAVRYISEPRGTVAVIWMLGEVGQDLKGAPYALEKHLIDSYSTIKHPSIKSALLTATLKLFFARPPEVQAMLGRLLAAATEDVSDQDLHDRALFYYRILQADPAAAEAAIGGASGKVEAFAEDDVAVVAGDDGSNSGAALLEEYNTLSVIYGTPSEHFIAEEFRAKMVLMPDEHIRTSQEAAAAIAPAPGPAPVPAPTVTDVGETLAATTLMNEAPMEQPTPEPVAVELLSPAPVPGPTPAPAPAPMPVGDLLDFMDNATAPVAAAPTLEPPELKLTLTPGLTLTGDEYQTLWGAHTDDTARESFSFVTTTTTAITTATAEAALQRHHISTMASGELPDTGQLKFFLYAQDDSECVYLLQTVLNVAGRTADIVVRTDADLDRCQAMVRAVRDALGST